MATTLGLSEVADLVTQNLEEEETAAKKILSVSQAILEDAAGEPETDEGPETAKEKTSARKSKEDEKKAASEVKKRAS